MRVLQVIGAMDRGGAETVVMNLLRVMDREKVQFDFLVHTQRRCDYDDEIEALGDRIYRVPLYNIVNARKYRACCREHFRAHPEHRVVHGHIGSCAGIYLDEAQKAGRATVLHSHSQNYERFPMQQIFNWMARPGLKVADFFLACSPEAGRDRFGDAIFRSELCRVMPNGVDTSLYRCDEAAHKQAKADLGLAGNLVVGHVGRFIEVKNHRFLLKVFARLHDRRPDARLLLLGRGPLEDDVRAQARDLGLEDCVVFCGVRDDVPRYLKAFDLFVFPSVLEGLPMATIEAQAAGVPCLFSTGVPQSALASGFARRLDLEAGEEAWAAAALEQAALDRPRVEGASDVARAGYDIRKTAQWLADLYVRLASGLPE